MDFLVGGSLIALGLAILVRTAWRRPAEIIGRNEAMKRMLEK